MRIATALPWETNDMEIKRFAEITPELEERLNALDEISSKLVEPLGPTDVPDLMKTISLDTLKTTLAINAETVAQMLEGFEALHPHEFNKLNVEDFGSVVSINLSDIKDLLFQLSEFLQSPTS
jgi:hypothetical protein